MTQDVRQWLAEIKSLQQKWAEACQERDEAYASASKWRSLYETEAKQRRTDASLSRQTIDELKMELDRLHRLPDLPEGGGTMQPAIQQEIAQIESIAELQSRLAAALLECDRLTQALKAEQAEHAKTRQSLTTALGDTVDLLTKERGEKDRTERDGVAMAAARAASKHDTHPPTDPKNPSLELPHLE